MGSSYTQCNSTKVTPFLDHRFVRDLTITMSQLTMTLLKIYFLTTSAYLINNISFFSQYSLTSFISPNYLLFSLSLSLPYHCRSSPKVRIATITIFSSSDELEVTSSLIEFFGVVSI